MIIRHIVTIIISMTFLSGCSSLTVNYDYDQQVDFSRYHNYDWLATPDNKAIDEFNRARFTTAIDNNLSSKGFVQNTSNPDFLIATHFGREKKVDISTWGYTYAPATHYRGYGYRYPYDRPYTVIKDVSVYEYEQGTLILDLIDAKSKKLIWRATAKAIINTSSTPEQRTRKINKAVDEILESFPQN